jgi:hypothetical protein
MPFLDLAGRVNADIETFLWDHFPSPAGG